MPFEAARVSIHEIIDFEPGEVRAIRFKLPYDIDTARRPGNAFWARLWGERTKKLETRAYSLSDSSCGNIIETVVSKAPENNDPKKPSPNTSLYLQGVKVGTEIELRLENSKRKLFINPRKDLELESDDWWPDKKFLLLGLGSGVTPHLSVIRYMALWGMPSDVVYVSSARYTPGLKRLIFHKELEETARKFATFKYYPFVTRVEDPARDCPDWKYYFGRPTLVALLKIIPDLTERHLRLCGGANSRTIYEKEAASLGIKFASIRSEEW